MADLQGSFDAGLFDKVNAGAKSFLQKSPKSPLRFDVAFLQGRALYFQGQYAQALAVFASATDAPDDKAPSFLFWRAETLAAQGAWPDAEKGYRDLLARYAGAPDVASGQAQLGLAWVLYKEGNGNDSRALLASLMQAQPPTEIGEKAALVLVKIEIADNRLDDAVATLDALAARKARPASATTFEADYWRGELALLRGKDAEAIGFFRRVVDNPKAFPQTLVAESWFDLGTGYQKTNDHARAMAAFEKAYTLARAEPEKLAAFRLYLRSAAALQRLPEAQGKLREFAKNEKSPVTASAALFAIASSQAEGNTPADAIQTFEALLTAYPQTIWRADAYSRLGQLYADAGKTDQALAALQSCVDAAQADGPGSASLAREAQFKAAELYFSKADYAKAADLYRKAAAGPGAAATTEKALFNLLLSEARVGDLPGFLQTEGDFAKAFPASPLAVRVVMEKASLYLKAGKTDEARAAYRDALDKADKPQGDVATLFKAQKPLLLLRLADLERAAGKTDDALALYNRIGTEFPDDPRVAEAAYAFVMVGYEAGKITSEQAREQLLALARRFDKSPEAASILFTAAEFFHQQQDYASAQTHFETMAKNYPDSPLLPEALYFAGESALKLKDYGTAIQILEKIPDASPRKAAARLLQGLAYHVQGKYTNAIALFDAVLGTEKGGSLFVTATLRKGNALYALGGGDATRYEQAASVYGTLLNSTQGDFSQRSEAAYFRGKCFEKLNRIDDALTLYLAVLNGQTMPGGAAVPLSSSSTPPEVLWRTKAGIDAAELRKRQENWRAAADLYRRLEALGGPNQAEFRDALTRLRREHFLFDDEPDAAAPSAATPSSG